MDKTNIRLILVALAIVLITILGIRGNADDRTESADSQIGGNGLPAENAPVVVPLPPEENNKESRYGEEVGLPDRNR